MSQKYVIVHFIEKSKVPEEFPSSAWPLHVTLLANFTLVDMYPGEDITRRRIIQTFRLGGHAHAADI